jgi:PAS domain S-box-containing protein
MAVPGNSARAQATAPSIRRHLLILALALTIPLSAFVAALILIGAREQRLTLQRAMRDVALQAAGGVRYYLDGKRAVMGALTSRVMVQGMRREACDPLLADIRVLQPDLRAFGLVDLDGQLLCAPRDLPQPPGNSLVTSPWFQRARGQNAFAVSDVYDSMLGGPTVQVTMPVRRGDAIVGMLAFPINLGQAASALTMGGGSSNAVVTVLDGTGRVVARSHDAASWIGQTVPPEYATLRSGEGDGLLTDLDGVERIVGWAPVPGTDWTVYGGVSAEVVQAGIDQQVRASALLGVFLLSAMGGLGHYLARRIAGPLGALATAAGEVAQGHRQAIVAEGDIREVHDLARELDLILRSEIQARAEAQELAALVSAVAATDDVRATLDAAIAALPRLMNVDTRGIALPDPDGILRYHVVAGTSADVIRAYEFRPGDGLVGQAFATGTLTRSTDLDTDPSTYRPEIARRTGAHAFVAAPLRVGSRVLGVLAASSPAVDGFDDHDAALLTAIADHIAVALAAAQARAAARAELAQKSAVLEYMADAVLVFDRGARVVAANQAAGDVLGEDAASLIGLVPDQFGWRPTAGTHADVGRFVDRILGGEAVSGEHEIVRRDGRRIWIELRSSRLTGDDGAVEGAILVGRDVTARHLATALEAEERAARAQSEKLRALGQLASGVAHDLSHSLALVATYGEITQEELKRPALDLSSLRANLATMTRAAHDGGETLRRLVAFARGGSMDVPARPVDLAAVLHEVAELTAPRWRTATRAQGKLIRLDVDAEPGLAILGWAAALREALTNLVLNAVDALPDGGSITLGARSTADGVVLSVADSGVGMAPETRARIFEPYFTTKGAQGTGLGLAMVFGIVERHGGSIDVQTTPGGGTTFAIVLPASALAAEPAGPAA